MADHSIDQIARVMATPTTRRRTFGMLGAIVGLIASSRLRDDAVLAAPSCITAGDCHAGMICEGGFCLFPACYETGESCSSHDDCCNDNLCTGGICVPPTYCGFETEGCGSDSDCCPGLACLGGVCAVPAPPPPETGGGTVGGGSTGGGGSTETGNGNTSGGQTGGGGSPESPSAAPGSTTSGVTVASLPKTGSGTSAIDQKVWNVVAGLAAVVALATGRKAVSGDPLAGDQIDTD